MLTEIQKNKHSHRRDRVGERERERKGERERERGVLLGLVLWARWERERERGLNCIEGPAVVLSPASTDIRRMLDQLSHEVLEIPVLLLPHPQRETEREREREREEERERERGWGLTRVD